MNKSKTCSPEVRERARRMVFDHSHEHTSRWAAIRSVAERIGCSGETLRSTYCRFASPSETRASGVDPPRMSTAA